MGSSRIRILESWIRALAISTICFWATPRSSTLASGEMLEFSSLSSSTVLARMAGLSKSGPRHSSLPRKMFSNTVMVPMRLNSWGTVEMPSRLAARGDFISIGRPLSLRAPEVGW